jgi:hypothetical protein
LIQFRLQASLFVFDPILLRLQQVLWQRVCVEGLEQLLALAIKHFKASAKAIDVFGVRLFHSGQCLAQRLPYILQMKVPSGFGRARAKLNDLDRLVLRGHLILNLMCRDVGKFAAGPLDAPETSEVVVDPAGFALALHERHALAA